MPDSGRILSAHFKSGDLWNLKKCSSLCGLIARHSEEETTHALPLSNEKLGHSILGVYRGRFQPLPFVTLLQAGNWKRH